MQTTQRFNAHVFVPGGLSLKQKNEVMTAFKNDLLIEFNNDVLFVRGAINKQEGEFVTFTQPDHSDNYYVRVAQITGITSRIEYNNISSLQEKGYIIFRDPSPIFQQPDKLVWELRAV